MIVSKYVGYLAILSLMVLTVSACTPTTEETTNVAAESMPPVEESAFDAPADSTMATGNIVEVAQGAGTFNTLIAAAIAADLADVLATTPNITVFAPTDAAFDALPAGTVEALLANPAELSKILSYHVIPGVVSSEAVLSQSGAMTLQGSEVAFSVENGTVMVNNATVVQADILATNGVIHAIDTVLMPPQE